MEKLSERGACYNCGFLCRKDVLNTHLALFYEISEEDRKNGRFFTLASPGAPRCFRGVDIGREITDATGLPDYPIRTDEHQQKQNAAAKQVLETNRQCKLWFPYTPGMSPKEHLEEFKILEMERDRKEWQERLEANRREWQKELVALEKRENKRINRVMIWLAVAAAILAVAEVAAAVSSLTPDSLLWRSFWP